jgi:hypothetical protein
MKLKATFLLGALICTAQIHARQPVLDAVRLAAANPDCLSDLRLGQAAAVPALAHAASARVEEYLQLHAEAVESSEHGALLPWLGLRARAD